MLTLLIRCATWMLIAWLVSMNPVVTAHARRAVATPQRMLASVRVRCASELITSEFLSLDNGPLVPPIITTKMS